MSVLPWVGLALLLVGSVAPPAHADTSGTSAGFEETASPEPGAESCRGTRTLRFVFHDDAWVNLHHMLFAWARNVPDRREGDRRRSVDIPESEGSARELDGRAAEDWENALSYYRDHLVEHSLRSPYLVALRETIARIACEPEAVEELEAAHGKHLVRAMGVYRTTWWDRHSRDNSAWIGEIQALLLRHERTISQEIADAYGGEWPSEAVRVDVSSYAGWAGAYTTNRPNRLSISSRHFTGWASLEILFHEASHASFFEQSLLKSVSTAFREEGVKTPPRLFHVVQFVTPAEILRNRLTKAERESYISIASRVHDRPGERRLYESVVQHWGAFLRSEAGRADALREIVQEIAASN